GEAGHTMRLRLQVAPVRHLLFDTGEIDGFGWSCFTAAEGPATAPPRNPGAASRGNELSNEHLRVTVDPTDGSYTIETANGLRVSHEIDNPARDHRLRAHFPLPARVDGSDAECAFAVVHRGLTAEGGAHEVGLPTFPSRRFVDASDGTAGLALIHDGLLEYEVIADGNALALTLLRAVGFLSRIEPQLRPNPAGPPSPLAGPQLLGPQRADYAVMLHTGDWRVADCYGAADAFLVPFERTRLAARSMVAGSRPPTGAAL